MRALLIRLAVDVGRTVPADRLIDDLWGDAPPAGAANALQALVSRLRGVGGHDAVESVRAATSSPSSPTTWTRSRSSA